MEESKQIDLENKLAFLLALSYRKIKWKQIRVKNAHTFFVDRIRASGTSRDLKEFLDTLNKKIGVDFVKYNTEIIDELSKYDDFVMSLIRRESLYITNLALEKVEEMKQEEKKED